jgi:hypothetical protein
MTSSTDRAWEIIEKVGVCMLTTRTSKGEFRSRPVEARPCRDEGCIYVVTDIRSAKEYEIERDAHLGLTFTDQTPTSRLQRMAPSRPIKRRSNTGGDRPIACGGKGQTIRMCACVLQAELTSGPMWDGPSSKAVELFEFIKAKVTGEKPNLGENRKADVSFGPRL